MQAAGYELVPLRHAVGPGGLLGTCSQGLLLVAFPVNTRRLIHWNADGHSGAGEQAEYWTIGG